MNERVKSNPPFEVQSLRNKLDSFVKRYRSEKQKQSQTGAEPSSWEHYEQMHRIRGPSPKEKGIPDGCDGGNDVREGDINIIDLEDDCSENMEEQFMHTVDVEGLSFQDLLFGNEENAATPRTKACGQPGVAGKPNRKRKSGSNDDLMTTMRDFVQVIKENNEDKKSQEREKISLMRDLVELRREELALQRQERLNQHMPSGSNHTS
ncbi:hypothetical protein R1sor_001058 [Riccia sorocarpa]|uniref:Uncharacterized protein n=1 Tax=Riccia sorocarpa TaxID=122646 RepID=A0ABD3GZ29_9MARC